MYVLNKIVGWCVSPVGLALVGFALALLLRAVRRGRLAQGAFALSLAWLWIWSTPLMGRIVGATLERPYLVDGCIPPMESLPVAEAIELHGGSMGDAEPIRARGEMWTSADRVWMAARLYKAGKAPRIHVMGTGAPKATIGLLEDFGVPTNALVCCDQARNTEEEARFVSAEMVRTQGDAARPKVLVVTSAWHMKRTMLMYEKYAPQVEAIPAPCDFENTLRASHGLGLADFLPSDDWLLANRVSLHEWVGILGYRFFRR